MGAGAWWAACRLTGTAPVGYGELVGGVIEQLELDDGEELLAWLHGRSGRWATSRSRG